MCDVLIIGAGPTGLTVACELLKRGINVRIIDQATQPSIYSKALGIHSRTLEVFEKMDLIEQFLKHGQPLTQIQFHYQEKNFLFTLNLPDEVPYPFVLIHPQSDTEMILNNALENLNVSVERGVTLKNIFPEENAILQHADGNEEIVYPKWIIACDGAHSSARNILQIPFKGKNFIETFVLADVKIESTISSDHANVFVSEKGFCGLVPLPKPSFFRVIIPFNRDVHLEKNVVNEEFIQKILNDRIMGHHVTITSSDWISLFYIHRHIASQLQYKNVFLAGDAAHVHSPAGGQGLNTSVQDAQNLAWKLALVIKNQGHSNLLESYEKERLPVAKKVLKNTTHMTQRMTFFQRNFFSSLFNFMSLMMKNKGRQRKISYSLSELDVYYEENSIIKKSFVDLFWGGPQPGHRAPDVKLSDQDRLFLHFKDLRHILLFFEDQPSGYFAEKIKTQYDPVIKVLVVSKEQKDKNIIFDPENKILNRYNAKPGSFYLIRPDGYVAFRQKKLNETKFHSYLEKIFKLDARTS